MFSNKIIKFLSACVIGLLVLNPFAFPASTATCFDNDTVLMSHMNGSDFTDSSASGKTITAAGDAQIDTAQSKFSGASGLFDGTGDYTTTSDSSDFDIGSGDFTIDLQARFASTATSQTFVGHFSGSDNQRGYVLRWLTSNVLSFQWSTDGGSGTVASKTFSWTPSTGTWYHVALVRSGNDLYAFVDGTQIGTTQDMTGVTIFNPSTPFTIGDFAGPTIGSSNPMNGWIDEVRVVKGTAIWTSNFTAPSAEYTTCTNGTKSLALMGVGQ